MNNRQLSFSKGEITPALYARADLVAYATGLRTCRNFIVRRTGGVDNRPGTEYLGTAPAGAVRLIPFVFNDAQTYVLEFSDKLVRFIKNGAYLGAPYSVVTPYAAADLAAIQYTQSADVLTLVHPSYPVAELSRLADTSWTYTVVTFGAAIAPPTGVAHAPAGGDGTYFQWVVTAVDATTGQESIASAVTGTNSIALPTARTITWNPVANAKEYNVYKGGTPDGTTAVDFGFVGSTGSVTAFYDNNITPDRANRVTVARNPFATNYPGAVGFYQQRRILAGSTAEPGTVYTSRTADYKNFSTSAPTQDDDAVTFGLVSKKVNQIKHILDAAELLVFTSGGEWVIRGDGAGILRPTDVNALQFSQHGCSALAPIQIGSRVLFVQARQAVIRDLAKDYYYGYRGTDMTLFSGHLFDGHTIVDWCYQEVPHSIIWCVRDDGVLLALTDVAEQEIAAWHHHDTLGTITACCVVPEGGEDRLYLAVTRNGSTRIERMASRFFTNVQDGIFTDSTLSYDGRNTGSTTMTLTGGTLWTFDELLTCTRSVAGFVAGDVGNGVYFTAADGSQLRFIIAGYTSATVVTGYATQTVPADLRGIAKTAWARAVDVFSGINHLEGLSVSVVGDGYVVANPNNPASTTAVTVTGGSITLDRPYAYIHAGLPYVSDLQTLDVDTPSGPSLKASRMKIDKVLLEVIAARGLFAGSGVPVNDSTLAPLFSIPIRNTEAWGQPVALTTGTLEPVSITNSWSREGRAFVRQVDPVPCTILAVILQSV